MDMIKFPKDMCGACDTRKAAEELCNQLEAAHGVGSHYVYIGSGTYRYVVRPTPWFARKKFKNRGFVSGAIFNG
jgi:hypothetical protein